ncbi:MAG: toll/interleukin-1 receptor domain-containing protein [Actinomycetota bacterium]
MEWDVFVSHASANKAQADAVVDALTTRGLRCWIAPECIPIGADYANSIIEGIRASRGMVILLSSDSVESHNVIREVERAHHLKLPLLTIRLEDIQPWGSLEYFLASRQFVDAFPSVDQRSAAIADAVAGVLGEGEVEPSPAVSAGVKGSAGETGSPEPELPPWQRLSPGVLAGAAAVIVLLIVIAAVAIGGDDGTTTAGSDSSGTGETSAPTTTGELEIIGPESVGVRDQTWFYLPDAGDDPVVWEWNGEQIGGPILWIQPFSTGTGVIEVTVGERTRTITYAGVTTPAGDLTCYQTTTAEMLDLLNAITITRRFVEFGDNVCAWDIVTTGGAGTVKAAIHQTGSGDARRAWFLAGGATPVDDIDGAWIDERNGELIVLANAGADTVEASLPIDRPSARADAIAIVELLRSRTGAGERAPQDGCAVLTPAAIEAALGVVVEEVPEVDPQRCGYTGAAGISALIGRFDGVDPSGLDQLVSSVTTDDLDARAVDGIGDRALQIDDAGSTAILTVVDGIALAIVVADLSGESTSDRAAALASAAIDAVSS